jgi:hypothetical protein
VLDGESYELRVLAAQGILPLSPEELVPLQVHLAGSDDPFLAEAATSSLAAVDTRIASAYLASEAPPEVLAYFAQKHDDTSLVEAILRRRDVDRQLLVDVAPRLSADLQEMLLLRQDAILEEPEILDALTSNPRLSSFAERRIAEYRAHLVRPEEVSPSVAVVSDQFFPEEEELDEDERAALAAAQETPAGGEVDRTTGLSEHQIRALPVPLRMRLARGASRTLRSILVKDLNTNVALSVLSYSAFTEDEIEHVAASRAVVEDVLVAITKKREWAARYGVTVNLARNPKLPVSIALRLVARLSVKDLRNLSRDRNAQDAVRSAARRLYRIKMA